MGSSARVGTNRRFLPLLLGLAWGCAFKPAQGPSAFETLKEDPDAVVERIARLRQLPQLRPTRLVFHEPQEFQDIVAEQVNGSGVLPTSADHPAFQHAFGFAGARGQAAESLSEVQRDEVVAFFDERTFTVHVRADADEDPDASLSPAWVVAHEVGHSLQHQHFPIPDVAAMRNEDQRLAALAMLEGDAMLVMLAYASYEQHAPLSRTVARVTRAIARDAANEYGNVTHSSAALDHAPASVRERLVFPYLAGAVFMGSLYRAGGFPLVNQVYLSPPSTTEQVLHPERYVVGEGAVPVLAPRLPSGFTPIASGSMGELQVKTMLAACNPPDLAERAAAGWGGDAFAIGAQGKAGLLLWATSWDTEADAQEFEAAVEATASCWRRELGPRSGATAVLRAGSNVAVTRGLGEAQAAGVLRQLLLLPQARPANREPLGSVVLRPVGTEPSVERPRVEGAAVVAPYLGLTIPIPAGFEPELGDEIVLEAPKGAGTLMLLVSDWVVTPRTNDQLFADFLDSFSKAVDIPRDRVQVFAEARRDTALGAAFQRTWRVKGTPLWARLIIVPACQHSGSLVLAQSWTDPNTLAQMDWVLAHLRQVTPGLPPLCSELNP